MSGDTLSANKTERLLEVFLCLSQSSQPVTKAQLRNVIEDYVQATSDEAFEKTFERDKAELRDLGVPLETVQDSEIEGYRIDVRGHALPPVEFTVAETAVLALARRVWHEDGAPAADRALRKLEAVGASLDTGAIGLVEPRLTGGEHAFGPLVRAAASRQAVTFEHRRPGATATALRRLQPFGVVSRRGRWYVVGHDLDRAATRAFRLDRVCGPVTAAGPTDSYSIPSDVDLTSLVGDPSAVGERVEVAVLLRSGAGHRLRAEALDCQPLEDGWDRVTVETSDTDLLARELLALGPDAVVESPVEVRGFVLAALAELAAEGPH